MSIARLITACSIMLLFACSPAFAQDSPHVGLKIRTLTGELRKQHKLPDDAKGALVTAVTPGSPAQEKGIAVGEVIVEAGSKAVGGAKDVASQINATAASGGNAIVFRIMDRRGERRDVTIPLEKRPAESPKTILPTPK